jgi:hypothetical protein
VAPLEYFLDDIWKGLKYFLYPFRIFWPYITLKYCNLPRSGIRKNRISTHIQWHSRRTNLCNSFWIFSRWQMKGTHVLFIPFPHILAIHYTGHKSTQKGEISSERNFPHDIIGIACTDLDTTFFQKTLIDLCLVTKTCLHINWSSGIFVACYTLQKTLQQP